MTLYLILKSKRLQLLPENLIMVTMLHAKLPKKNRVSRTGLQKYSSSLFHTCVHFRVGFSREKGLLFLVFCTLFLSSLMLINRHFGEEVRDKFFFTSKLTDKLVIAVTRFCCSRHLLKVLIAVQYDIPSCFI